MHFKIQRHQWKHLQKKVLSVKISCLLPSAYTWTKCIFIPALHLVEIWIYHTFSWVHVGKQLVKELKQRPSILLCLIKKPIWSWHWSSLLLAEFIYCITVPLQNYISSIITGWDPCGQIFGRWFKKQIWNGVRLQRLSKRSALEAAGFLGFGTIDLIEGHQHHHLLL